MPKTFLNLGSGPRSAMPASHPLFRGWREFRVDVDEGANPDAVASIVDLSGIIDDNSVEIVFCSHVVEHFFAHEVPLVLSEIVRVLRPDGVAVFRSPDLVQVVALLDPMDLEKPLYSSPAGDITVLDVIYGHRQSISEGNTHMAHRCGFTEEYFAKLLLEAGFEEVQTQRSTSVDFWATATIKPTLFDKHAALLTDEG